MQTKRIEYLTEEQLAELLNVSKIDAMQLIKQYRVRLEPSSNSDGWSASMRTGQKKSRFRQFGGTIELAIARCVAESIQGNKNAN